MLRTRLTWVSNVRELTGWLEAQTGWPEETVLGRPISEVIPGFAERGLDRYYRAASSVRIRGSMSQR